MNIDDNRRHTMAAVISAVVLLCLVFSQGIFAQSRAVLDTLFFDAVYPDDPGKILLTSGDREGVTSIPRLVTEQATIRESSEIIEDIRSYEASINSQIEAAGIYDPVLAQEYLATGDLYEQLGDRENAVQSFENAMHINRVNQGLFTLAQADAVQALIDSNLKAGDFAEADKYQEYLYYILSRNLEPDSDELVNATLSWADWNLEAYRRMTFLGDENLSASSTISSVGASMLRRGELVAIQDDRFSEILFIPRSIMFANPGAVRMQAYTADQLMDPRLKQAEDLYDKLLENNPDNLEVLQRKADIIYQYKIQLEQSVNLNTFGSTLLSAQKDVLNSVSMLRRGYSDARDSLVELAMSVESEDPAKAAEIYLDIGDWDLAFGRTSRGRESYSQARELLLAQNLTENQITEFISPEPALLIPDYITYEYTRAFHDIPESTDIPYIGFIDVSFDKRENGSIRRLDIVNVSENTGQLLRNTLLKMLRDKIMRPLFVAGDTVSQSDITVRYYYSY